MLLDFKRVIAYICPFCSNLSTRKLSLFNFSGGVVIKLICPVNGCHEECAEIHQKKDKYRIDIECPVCGETHSHTIKAVSFWNKPLVTYKCPESNIEILYIGEHGAVESALMKNSGMYDGMGFGDEQRELYVKIIDRIQYLYNNDCIVCSCGNDRIAVAIHDNEIALSCGRCHKIRYIKFTEETLKMLKNIGSIVI